MWNNSILSNVQYIHPIISTVVRTTIGSGRIVHGQYAGQKQRKVQSNVGDTNTITVLHSFTVSVSAVRTAVGELAETLLYRGRLLSDFFQEKFVHPENSILGVNSLLPSSSLRLRPLSLRSSLRLHPPDRDRRV